MSIKIKLALMLIGLIALVVGVVTVTVYTNYSNRLNEQLRMETAAKMDGASERIASWYRVNAQNIKTLRNEALHRIRNIESIRPSLVSGLKDNAELSSIYFCDIVKIAEGGAFIEATGWVPPVDYDQYKRGWFTDTLKTKDVVLTAPYIDSITKIGRASCRERV